MPRKHYSTLSMMSPGISQTTVRVASTANIATLSGLLTVDNVVLLAGDRVLVKNQATASQNGIYTAAAGAWARATDADASGEIYVGRYVGVTEGQVWLRTVWFCTSTTTDPWVVGSGSTWLQSLDAMVGPSTVMGPNYVGFEVPGKGGITVGVQGADPATYVAALSGPLYLIGSGGSAGLTVGNTAVTATLPMTVNGGLTLTGGGASITSASGTPSNVEYRTNNVMRWSVGKGGGAESSGNVGSEFNIARWSDAGAYIDNAVSINRANAAVSLSGSLTATTTIGIYGAGGYMSLMGTGSVGVYWAAADMFLNNYNGSTTTLYLLNAAATAWKDLQVGNFTANGNAVATGNVVATARLISQAAGGSGDLTGFGFKYIGYTNGGVAGANYIGLSWRSPNLVGGADNANTMVLGTVSNRKWKADIQSLSNTRAKGGAGALDEVEQLNVVEYSPRDVDGTVIDERHRGLITDEVKLILPGAVVGDDPDNDALNYMEIVPTLVAAIQELSAQVKGLKAQLASLA